MGRLGGRGTEKGRSSEEEDGVDVEVEVSLTREILNEEAEISMSISCCASLE